MFLVSDSAKKKLKRQIFLKFWVFSPVILLIAYKDNETSKPILKAHIVSKKELSKHEHYMKKIIEIDELLIIPSIDVYFNVTDADKWLLDVASNGSFILFADGKLIDPYWPEGFS
ncbi:MAG: hypothetical protein ABW201_13145 [Candidatus Thiodiazotropha sp.]